MSVMEKQLLTEYQSLSKLCQVKARHYASIAEDQQVRNLLQQIEQEERQNEQLVTNVLSQAGVSQTSQ
jgi:hypothetical protein